MKKSPKLNFSIVSKMTHVSTKIPDQKGTIPSMISSTDARSPCAKPRVIGTKTDYRRSDLARTSDIPLRTAKKSRFSTK